MVQFWKLKTKFVQLPVKIWSSHRDTLRNGMGADGESSWNGRGKWSPRYTELLSLSCLPPLLYYLFSVFPLPWSVLLFSLFPFSPLPYRPPPVLNPFFFFLIISHPPSFPYLSPHLFYCFLFCQSLSIFFSSFAFFSCFFFFFFFIPQPTPALSSSLIHFFTFPLPTIFFVYFHSILLPSIFIFRNNT